MLARHKVIPDPVARPDVESRALLESRPTATLTASESGRAGREGGRPGGSDGGVVVLSSETPSPYSALQRIA